MPKHLTGIGVSSGRAAAPVYHLALPVALPSRTDVTDAEAEKTRAEEALRTVASDLRKLADNANSAEATDVLQAQALMAEDPFLAEAILAAIDTGISAPHAIHASFAVHREAFLAAGGVMAERVGDLDDLCQRTIAAFLGEKPPGIPYPGHRFILAARDLAPADTATLDRSQVMAIVTESGGPTSHTAILARALGVPAVVGCHAITDTPEGTLIGVDGVSGEVTIDVPESQLEHFRAESTSPIEDPGGPGATADGVAVPLLINIGTARDLQPDLDCEGVGLFRTELLYLHRRTPPTVDEQTRAYAEVFAAAPSDHLVVRTLDAGADKPLPFLEPEAEPNPALGVRGLRLARTQPLLLDEQLQALAQAAEQTGLDPKVMAPMVSTPQEAADFAVRARAAGLNQVGVMIEVPAAALTAEEILQHVDFLSIGTNDLSQYTFAADRENPVLAELLNPNQVALLKLIALCGQAGKKTGKPVGVCGEAAADPLLAPRLVGMGIGSLSMSPGAIPGVRAALSQYTMDECQAQAQAALA